MSIGVRFPAQIALGTMNVILLAPEGTFYETTTSDC